MSLPTALPYGIRDLKLTPYLDSAGTQLGSTSYDLPNMQTLTFAEKEEFQELRGDDRLIATRGKGSQVEWDLEAGGLHPQVWSVITGGQIIESGVTPNIKVIMRKRSTDARPYFRIEGLSISDSGGNIRALIYRARCNDSIQGEFKDGEFFITKASGVGLPLLVDTNDLLYDIIQDETKVSLSLTPTPNPLPVPFGLTTTSIAATTVGLTWDYSAQQSPVPTGYKVQQSVSPFTTWTAPAGGGSPTTPSTTVTGLTTATAYKFRVAATVSGNDSEYCTPIAVTTA